MKTAGIGIIGGGLMGREAASAFGRWFMLNDFPVKAELRAVCDLNESVLDWYKNVPTVEQLTTDYRELLANPNIDVVYVAVPHNLHLDMYLEVMRAGKDLLAEKPFGIDLEAAHIIKQEVDRTGRFVRCSSEFPFLPGVQRVMNEVKAGKVGQIIEIRSGFLHSSDLDLSKPINWKRQTKYCGESGVLGDLGMHVVHIPLRMGWKPEVIFANLQKIVTERPDGKGGMAECDTWNNAILNTQITIDNQMVPMTLEMKRLAPGETNTWYIEVYGTEGGIKYSTKDTKALWLFKAGKEQLWQRTDLGFAGVPFPVVTGGIFEMGFPDYFMQMLAAYMAEREGALGDRFGCATPEEAVESHKIFAAALQSAKTKSAINIAKFEAQPA